jgi:Complex I intermediate-associated protein 30 (CIA30)
MRGPDSSACPRVSGLEGCVFGGYLVVMRYDRRKVLLLAAYFSVPGGSARGETMSAKSAVIDDLSREPPLSAIGSRWQLFTDCVMGGISDGTMVRERVAGRPAIRMRGDVRLENNGGFVQIAIDLVPDGKGVDASAWQGVEFDVFGNGEEYSIHLRTEDLTRPWQSYRHTFRADSQWRTVQCRFQDFVPYRTDTPLDTRRLRRIGVVAIGRAFSADLSVGGLRYLA